MGYYPGRMACRRLGCECGDDGMHDARDFAYFEAERVSDEEIRIIRRVEDEGWSGTYG